MLLASLRAWLPTFSVVIGVDRARPEEASKSLEEAVWGKKKGRPALAAKNSRLQRLMSTLNASVLRNCCYFYEKNAERIICLFMSVWKHAITEGLFWGQHPVMALPIPWCLREAGLSDLAHEFCEGAWQGLSAPMGLKDRQRTKIFRSNTFIYFLACGNVRILPLNLSLLWNIEPSTHPPSTIYHLSIHHH